MKKLSVKEFNALPKNEKAVLVAKDVIIQLQNQKYLAETSRYISDVYLSPDFNHSSNKKLNEQFDKIEYCTVCAIGGMLLSCTHLGNKLTNQDFDIMRSSTIDELANIKVVSLFNSIFHAKTLLMIETAFEGYWNWNELSSEQIKKEKKDFKFKDDAYKFASDVLNFNDLSFEETYKCEMFYRKYKNDKNRMIKICENIIENKGTFKL